MSNSCYLMALCSVYCTPQTYFAVLVSAGYPKIFYLLLAQEGSGSLDVRGLAGHHTTRHCCLLLWYNWSVFKFPSSKYFWKCVWNMLVAASLALGLSPCTAVSLILLWCFNLVTHPNEAFQSLPFSKVHEGSQFTCSSNYCCFFCLFLIEPLKKATSTLAYTGFFVLLRLVTLHCYNKFY